MAHDLRIALLGRPVIVAGEEVGGFVSQKALLLFCYLVDTGQPHTREQLADLLWGEMPEARARANLRTALHNLQQLFPDYLETNRITVAFRPRAGYWLDVDEFTARLAPGSDAAQLAAAAALYRGEFLDGAALADAPVFEAWLVVQRERYRRLVVDALHSLVDTHTAQADHAAAIEQAHRLLAIEPWHEHMHRLVMQLLARQGEYTGALAQYKQFETILRQELDVAPLPETEALHARIRAARAVRHHSLPAQYTPFVGRRQELGELAARLRDPTCRVLTLTGLGGVGKTRLALQVAAEQASAFLNGVCFVTLADVHAQHGFTTAVAEALALPGSADATQLLDYLRPLELLLVLDNMEHLSAGAQFVADLVRAAPDVKALVTSRVRLNLREEWVYAIHGLACPAEKPAGAGQDATPCDAVQLFLQSAQRISATFDPPSLGPVKRICQLVEGMPLAIELAAGWTHALSCADILHEIEHGLDLLATPLHNFEERHRSLVTVFEHSWQLLTPDEQRAIGRLAVFQGSFTVEAARHVGATTPAVLALLVNKSLLRKGADERFEMHQLVRQYVLDRLNDQEQDVPEVYARHAAYYCGYLARATPALRSGGQQAAALAAVALDMGNIGAAWAWAARQRDQALVKQSLEALYLFYEQRGWFHAGIDGFESAALAFDAQDRPGAAPDALHAQLLARAGWFHWRLNRYQTARALLERSLALLPVDGDQAERIFVVNALGLVADSLGEYAAAREYHRQSLQLCRASGDRLREGRILNELGAVARILGNHGEALAMHHAARAIGEELGDGWGKATALNNLGLVTQRRGDYADAAGYFQEGLAIRRRLGDDWGIAVSQVTLADLACDRGEYAEAADRLRDSESLCHETGGLWGRAYWLLILGRLLREQADHAGAIAAHRQSLDLWRGMGAQSKIARTHNHLAADLFALERYADAEQHFRAAAVTAQRIGYRNGHGMALLGLAQVMRKTQSYRLAGLYFSRAQRLADAIGEPPLLYATLLGQAQLADSLGQRSRAQALLASILDAPAARYETRVQAAQWAQRWAQRWAQESPEIHSI
jgi:DNA-binding SARP family transcriptional activator/predicted ATPase